MLAECFVQESRESLSTQRPTSRSDLGVKPHQAPVLMKGSLYKRTKSWLLLHLSPVVHDMLTRLQPMDQK